jgi:SAM-dependent methyltransferase
VQYLPSSFDLVTSVSVVEHIVDDTAAVAAIWHMLRPGGRLLMTVPCAHTATDEYTDIDEYRLICRGEDGFVFWQRYYDEDSLERRIWSVTGRPASMRIYGEASAGLYDKNVRQKRLDPDYPYWREPLMMGVEYKYFENFDELVGMGVVAMEFVKPHCAESERPC